MESQVAELRNPRERMNSLREPWERRGWSAEGPASVCLISRVSRKATVAVMAQLM